MKNDDAQHRCFWLFKILDGGVFLPPPPTPRSQWRDNKQRQNADDSEQGQVQRQGYM